MHRNRSRNRCWYRHRHALLLKEIYYKVSLHQVVLAVKNMSANAKDVRDVGSVPGLGRFPGGCCCCCCVASVVSDSLRPHRQQPTRLPRPWDSSGKNTEVSCHFLLQCMKVKSESEVAQSCPDSYRPHGLQPTRLLCKWYFSGKGTGEGCHCLLQHVT